MTGDLLTGLWTRTQPPEWTAAEWERLFGQARRTRLLGRVAVWLQAKGWTDFAPPEARAHLRNALRTADRQRQAAHWEADCIRRAIGHLPTPIILLKGAAYVLADLPPGRSRRFGDIDILVAAEQLKTVEAALFTHGWASVALEPYDDRYYRTWSHELPPLRHIERGTVLDVHHSITQPGSRFEVDARLLLADARPVAGQPRLSVLAPVDMVLHSAAHLLQEGDFSRGLRDLLDLRDLLTGFGSEPGFWQALVDRAALLRLGEPLLDVLTQAQRTLDLAVPDDVWRRLLAQSPRPKRHRLMAALLRIALRPDHPDADGPATRTVRWCMYLRSHRLRMPLHRVVPHLLRKAWMHARHRIHQPPPAHLGPQ
jgi:hypothetical protein